MYTNCVWCYAELGSNESIEHFPVGRRLAFDPAKGWLWVVCRKCDRWNLTPIEERWEAIEECERRFRASRLRVSTDQIGLVRIDNGLDLIRIGAPLRPEFAVWRYGDRFARRRKNFLALSGAGLAGFGTLMLWPTVMRFAGGGDLGAMAWLTAVTNTYLTANLGPHVAKMYYRRRAVARVRIPNEDVPVIVRRDRLEDASIVLDGKDWSLHLPYEPGKVSKRVGAEGILDHVTELRGQDAVTAAAKLLPAINARGAKPERVKAAVGLIEETPDANALFARFAEPKSQSLVEYQRHRSKALAGRSSIVHDQAEQIESHLAMLSHVRRYGDGTFGGLEHGAPLSALTPTVRLALEMAAHESSERRAMEGELALLSLAWREAAEIASSADSMFLPEAIVARIDAMRKDRQAPPRGR